MGASSDLSGNKRARRILADDLPEESGSADLIERMDWACLMPELVEDIAGRLLALDVAEYLRLRAACKCWRQGTVGPRDGLDSRFRPRDWIVLSHCAAGTTRRRLLNMATAARADVDLPALSTHHHVGSVDGLLVLCDRATEAVRLLNPFTGYLTDFPPITAWVSVPPHIASRIPRPSWCTDVVDPSMIDGAGIDDSTSPPTLFLCLRGRVRWIVLARPGDRHWVSMGPYDFYGQVMYTSLLTRRGCTYFTKPDGAIWVVNLQWPEPWPYPVVSQETPVSGSTFVGSYLVPSHDAGDGMLMVRCISSVNEYKLVGDDRPLPLTSEAFTSKGIRRCIELLEVDLAAERLVPVRSLGRRAAFVGNTHCLLVSTEIFPSLAPNAVYLSRHLQELFGISVYYLDPESAGRQTEPVQEFVVSEDFHVLSPLHRPCSLADYLVFYVDRARTLYD